MMNNQSIGILDSGLGGLTIWNEITKQLPNESTIYIADSINCPYGNKDKDEIYKLSKRMVEFLLVKNVKVIIIACNTITVTCMDKLRKDFPDIPITGIVPVIKTAAEVTSNNRIGVLSTTRTAGSSYQKNLVIKFAASCSVFVHGTDELVPLIERGEIKSEEITKILKTVLPKFQKEQIDTLALGCSHFPFLEPEIKEIMGNDVLVLDSGGAIARQVRKVLNHNKISASNKNPVKHDFYTTGNINSFRKIAKLLKAFTITDNIQSINL